MCRLLGRCFNHSGVGDGKIAYDGRVEGVDFGFGEDWRMIVLTENILINILDIVIIIIYILKC